jgi:hypothetical protein
VGHCQKLKNNDCCFENAIAPRALEHVGPPAAGRFQSLTEAAVVGARAVIRATSGKAKEKPRHAEDRAKFRESVRQQRVDARRSGKEKPRPAHPLLALEAGLSSARSFAARGRHD